MATRNEQIAMVTAANTLGAPHNVYCVMRPIGKAGFVFKFFRKVGGTYDDYLGQTQLPDTIVHRMRRYCGLPSSALKAA